MKFRSIALLLILPVLGTAHASDWRKLEGCRLVPGTYRDGDSFKVQHEKEILHIRLYFVDAPETDNRSPDRLAEQEASFQCSPQQLRILGDHAADFSASELRRPFTVLTRMQNALGATGDRVYAFVTTNSGNDLAELLVENGLARPTSPGENHPNGRSEDQQRSRLETKFAKSLRKAPSNKMAASPSPTPPKPPVVFPDAPEHSPFDPGLESILTDLDLTSRLLPKPAKQAKAKAQKSKPKPKPEPESEDDIQGDESKISLNHSTQKQLIAALDEIGPARAKAIIKNRPYSSTEELLEKKIIPARVYDLNVHRIEP